MYIYIYIFQLIFLSSHAVLIRVCHVRSDDNLLLRRDFGFHPKVNQ